ncbi:ATP-grasp domain-containing protein [Photobacterium leiognathi]|uniref:ATP-grasp domain-containing protein n=1 Tax=Photobacterium leiognathi TaxID=553611 RepID=UPI0029815897|nr:ATP-grasp domain-containing protein [Photobacterium leiognathi]
MKNNILILSAGRRVELTQEFMDEVKKISANAKVFCTDLNPELSPACQIADGFFCVPRVISDNYIDTIEKICLEKNIGLVIPTIDTELELLSNVRERFSRQNIQVIISDSSFVSYCRDKRKTAQLFDSLNIEQPAILDKQSLIFPCFCKPYDGSCSKGAIALFSEDELTPELINDPKNMFMELVPKTYSEYTIDGYYSKDGQLKCLVPRKRLEVRGGEVSKGVTHHNFVYDYLLERVSYLEGARGCITFQFFVNEQDNQIKGLEINPRFGGGYPLSYAAGANFPKWLIQEFLFNQSVDFCDDWQPNTLMLRYDAKVIIHDYQ